MKQQGAETAAGFDCFAIVAPGLEPFALAEARELGLDVRAVDGGFEWSGDARSVLAANIGLRIASRVLVRLASFDARSFAELERRGRQVPWQRVVREGAAVRFRVTSRKSKLYHTGGIAQRLSDAVRRALPGVSTSEAADEAEDLDAATLIVVRFLRDHCTISADTSGALLHRRGYREATAKAPVRETIAAALLRASEWDATAPLVDPFCGSGTIPIEAALVALDCAPGVRRHFAVEHWPGVRATLAAEVRTELAARAVAREHAAIIGSDRDAGAIAAATANAMRAGVAEAVSFTERSISAASFPAGARGWVVTNPPYGVRVGESSKVRDLWATFGRVLRERARGWRIAVLSPDVALERQLGFSVQVVATTSNGGIPVRMVVAEVPA